MRRNIFRTLLTLALVILALEWASSGYILVQMGQWTLESRPAPLILALLAVIWLAWKVIRVWMFIRIARERKRAKHQELSERTAENEPA